MVNKFNGAIHFSSVILTFQGYDLCKVTVGSVSMSWDMLFVDTESVKQGHTLCKKASNHHANLPLEMYSFTLLPPGKHLETTGADDLTLWLSPSLALRQ